MDDGPQFLRQLIGKAALAGMFLAVVTIALHQLFWRPGWPTTPDKIKVPYAGKIIAAILVFVFIMLAVLVSRDPLAPRQ